MSKKRGTKISFTASLKQSTPSSKPIKFGPEGEAEIILETDAQQMTKVVRLLGFLNTTFKVTIEVE